MKTTLLGIAMTMMTLVGNAQQNPLLTDYGTPLDTPPFDRIREEHYLPAFNEAMKQESKEIDAIVANQEQPTFLNTIEALDRRGILLDRVRNVFYTVKGANTNDEIQKIANDVAPLLTKHRDDIMLNGRLFQRVKSVYEKRASLSLTDEQAHLLDETYKAFIRGGAGLSEEHKERFRKINEELSTLSLKFEENVLKETNSFKLIVDRKEDLAGLPAAVVDGASEAARWNDDHTAGDKCGEFLTAGRQQASLAEPR
jgi:peptidyl-dipeptidase Dcp